jgi:hypothetical protein
MTICRLSRCVAISADSAALAATVIRSDGMNFEPDEQRPGAIVDVLFAAKGRFEVRDVHPERLLRVDVH